jgi:excinuclease ABC subunit C
MQKLLENLPKITIRRIEGLRPDFFKSLPETAGIYCYFNQGKVIYVGKAINLKRRVTSYFDLDLEVKTARMISEATDISFIQVGSELEALLLEAKLIRSYMPHYNIAAKDDKHPLYILITKEEFPRVITGRKTDLENTPVIAVYGPFPSSRSVYTVLRMIRRIFPFSDHKIGKRACLYSNIGLCNPCPNEILMTNDKLKMVNLKKKYLKNIKNLKSILNGNIDKVSKDLEKEMDGFSKAENYEEAAKVRNQINHLEYITQPQMPTEFYMENPNLYDDQRKLEIDKLQKLIGHFGIKIENLSRIECYDIAHLAGTNPTASMITFINGEADKKFYRHFKIKKAKGGDDYASLAEVAGRRIKHFDDPTSSRLRGAGWGKPDLIIVDGGVGQVKAFTGVLYSNAVKIPVVGIAKHPDRLIIGEEKIKLEGPALNLVSRMRDEAHRFARRYHHKLIALEMKPKAN